MTEQKLYTADNLWELQQQPENRGKRLELSDGRLIEMRPTGGEHGELSATLIVRIGTL